MPEMRGNILAETLTDRYPKLRVIYMSGYIDSALIQSASLPEDMVVLQKPFTPDAMLRLIREVLDKPASSQGDKRLAV
jgi:DNA-binding NtrC family response regulator